MRFVSLSLVMTLASMLAAGEPAAQRVAVTTTWKELAAQPRVTLQDIEGQTKTLTVRLGLESDHAPRCSGVLLYALVENVRGPLKCGDERLGPLDVSVRGPKSNASAKVASVKAMESPRYGGTILFAYVLQLCDAGDYTVQITGPGLATEARVRVADAPFHAWSAFEPVPFDEALDAETLEGDATFMGFVKYTGAPAALPHVDGSLPLLGAIPDLETSLLPLPTLLPRDDAGQSLDAALRTRIDTMVAELAAEDFGRRESATNALKELGPGVREYIEAQKARAPLAEVRERLNTVLDELGGGMVLTAKPGELRLTLTDRVVLNWPNLRFLVRWWVNGQPVAPRNAVHEPKALNFSGLLSEGRSLRLKIVMAPEAIGAKTGDIVGVQLLHCPRGWRELSDTRLEHMLLETSGYGQSTRCSNRAEFKVP